MPDEPNTSRPLSRFQAAMAAERARYTREAWMERALREIAGLSQHFYTEKVGEIRGEPLYRLPPELYRWRGPLGVLFRVARQGLDEEVWQTSPDARGFSLEAARACAGCRDH